jgi:Rieske Fe-S protein
LESSSRRDFLRTVVLTAASLVMVGSASRADGFAATYVDVGPVSQFADGDWTRVVLPATFDQEVIFVRKAAGKPAHYEALSSRCTHRGCVVAYASAQHEFVCPCHGGVYNDSGVNISGPPPSPLPSLATKVNTKKHLLVAAPQLGDSSGD